MIGLGKGNDFFFQSEIGRHGRVVSNGMTNLICKRFVGKWPLRGRLLYKYKEMNSTKEMITIYE